MSDSKRYPSETAGTVDTFVSVNPPRPGISWGAIFAGAVVAVMALLVLNLLATGIGLTAFDLTDGTEPLASVAGGVGWAMIIINLVALGLGGWVAGRVAGRSRLTGGFLHGLLSWAVVTLFSVWLFTSAAGSAISGLGSVVSGGFQLAGQGISAVAPAAADAAEQALADSGVNLQDIRSDLMDLLSVPAAETSTAPASQAGDTAAGSAEPSSPLAQVRARALVNDLFQSDSEPFSADSREEMIALLAERTDLNEADATELVDSWAQSYEQARATLEEAQADVAAAADDARVILSRVALLGALGLVLAALLAGWLGAVGAGQPRPLLP